MINKIGWKYSGKKDAFFLGLHIITIEFFFIAVKSQDNKIVKRIKIIRDY